MIKRLIRFFKKEKSGNQLCDIFIQPNVYNFFLIPEREESEKYTKKNLWKKVMAEFFPTFKQYQILKKYKNANKFQIQETQRTISRNNFIVKLLEGINEKSSFKKLDKSDCFPFLC